MIKLTDTERAAILADARDNAEGAGVGDTLRLLADYDALERELDAALAELAEEQALRERMAELLRQSAVALRGPEPPLTRYSYADIPSRVKAVVEELAALKGGQEAVATVTISHFRQDPTMENVDFQLDAKLPCGTHKLYLAPPAQASAWVPEGSGITIERDLMGAMHIKLGDFDFIQIQYQYPYTDNAGTRQLAERIAELLAAAPTPGASDGKGGDV